MEMGAKWSISVQVLFSHLKLSSPNLRTFKYEGIFTSQFPWLLAAWLGNFGSATLAENALLQKNLVIANLRFYSSLYAI